MIEYPQAGWLLGLFWAQVFVRGLLNVLLVAASVQLLGLGEQGLGLLTAAMGAGGFVGALLAMTLVGRARVAPFFTLGLILWGTPILIIGLFPNAGLRSSSWSSLASATRSWTSPASRCCSEPCRTRCAAASSACWNRS